MKAPTVPVKDSDLRAKLLELFYQNRHDDRPVSFDMDEYPAEEHDSYNRILRQLTEHNLVELMSNPLEGRAAGKISAYGVDVIEGNVKSPISITLNDSSIRIHGSNNIQIGNSNTISGSLQIEYIEKAIDRTQASDADKQEAKSLIARLSNNATFGSIVGAIVSFYSTGTH